MSKKKDEKEAQSTRPPGPNVAILSIPRDPKTPSAYAPMLESLITLGFEVDDPQLVKEFAAEYSEKMKNFRGTCGLALEKAIRIHAKRMRDKWYDEHDTDLRECDRMTVVTSYGIYLSEAMERFYKVVTERNHTGVMALFDETLRVVTSALSEGFYDLNIQDVTKRLIAIQPLLHSALHAVGLSDCALDPKDAFLKTRDETIRRVEAAMDEMRKNKTSSETTETNE